MILHEMHDFITKHLTEKIWASVDTSRIKVHGEFIQPTITISFVLTIKLARSTVNVII